MEAKDDTNLSRGSRSARNSTLLVFFYLLHGVDDVAEQRRRESQHANEGYGGIRTELIWQGCHLEEEITSEPNEGERGNTDEPSF